MKIFTDVILKATRNYREPLAKVRGHLVDGIQSSKTSVKDEGICKLFPSGMLKRIEREVMALTGM